MPAVFDRRYVKRLDGPNVKKGKTWWEKHLMLEEDIKKFSEEKGVERMVMIWCGSTEAYMEASEVHQNVETFEKGLKAGDEYISPSMVYAYTAIKNRIPFVNGAPTFAMMHLHWCSLPGRWAFPLLGRILRPDKP